MDKIRVAKELLKIAKEMSADAGDIKDFVELMDKVHVQHLVT
jgi:hypothetical protein